MAVLKCPTCGTLIAAPDAKSGAGWAIGCLMAALVVPVVIAVIGLLAAIAIPAFVKARETSTLHASVNNLRMLDAAKAQVAMERGLGDGAGLSGEDVSGYLKEGFENLRCQKGGRYEVGPVGADPSCSVHGDLTDAMRRPRGALPQSVEADDR